MFNNNYALTEIPRHELGSNILVYRQMKELSQSELAKAAGYRSRSSINKIENNQTVPNAVSLARIAHALRINCDELFYGCDMEKYKDLYKQTCAIYKMNHADSSKDSVSRHIVDTPQADELDFIVQGNIELEKVHELLQESEELYKSYQNLYKALEDIAKQAQDESPEQQENNDLVFKYRQITAEHQQTVMTILNGFYQIDSQAQKKTAQTDGEQANKKTATAK